MKYVYNVFTEELDIVQSPGYATSESATISGGVITLTGESPFRLVTVDTESGAATDDLTSIIGGTDGERIILQSANNARTVVVKDVTGLLLQADFSLNNTADKIELLRISSGVWHELSRASNG